MRNLFYISLLAFFVSCTPSGIGSFKRQADRLPALESEFPQTFTKRPGAEFVYKATFDMAVTHFSGILIFKIMDNENLRATLITEVGSKIFDFEMSDKAMKLHYCVDILNKSNGILELIEDDFRILFCKGLDSGKNKLFGNSDQRMLQARVHKKKIYYFAGSADRKIYSVKRAGGLKKKLVMHFSDYMESYPDQIKITHPRIHLSIQLSPREKNKV